MASRESLASEIAVYIFNTFKVSIGQANEHAAEIKELIRAKGGDPSSFCSSDLKELATKQLKDNYEWKSSAARDQWDSKQKRKAESYNQFISTKRTRVFN